MCELFVGPKKIFVNKEIHSFDKHDISRFLRRRPDSLTYTGCVEFFRFEVRDKQSALNMVKFKNGQGQDVKLIVATCDCERTSDNADGNMKKGKRMDTSDNTCMESHISVKNKPKGKIKLAGSYILGVFGNTFNFVINEKGSGVLIGMLLIGVFFVGRLSK